MEQVWDIAQHGFLPKDTPCKWLSLELEPFETLRRRIPDYFGYQIEVDPTLTGTAAEEAVSTAAANAEAKKRGYKGAPAFVDSCCKLPKIKLRLFESTSIDDEECGHGVELIDLFTARKHERAFITFSFLTNAFVRAEEMRRSSNTETVDGPIRVPSTLAQPLLQLSNVLGRQPIVDYAASVLTNWALEDPTGGVTFENVEILCSFSHLESEEWFYKTHVVIEHHGARVIQAMRAAMHEISGLSGVILCNASTVKEIVLHLAEVCAGIQSMNTALKRMSERCKDVEFFDQIRPWLASWPTCGVVYELIDGDTDIIHLNGASGAQSTLLPSIDTFLGINYGESHKNTGVCEFAGGQESGEVTAKASPSVSHQASSPASKCPVSHQASSSASKCPVSQQASSSASKCPVSHQASSSASKCPASHQSNTASSSGQTSGKQGMHKKVDGEEEFREQILSYRKHMPPHHREFLVTVEESANKRQINMRCFIQKAESELLQLGGSNYTNPQSAGDDEDQGLPLAFSEMGMINSVHYSATVNRLKTAYNDCIQALLSFRRIHASFASTYIARVARKRERQTRLQQQSNSSNTLEAVTKPAMEDSGVKGTGGSNFTVHLRNHVHKTRHCLYDTPSAAQQAEKRHASSEKLAVPGLGQHLPRGTVFGSPK